MDVTLVIENGHITTAIRHRHHGAIKRMLAAKLGICLPGKSTTLTAAATTVGPKSLSVQDVFGADSHSCCRLSRFFGSFVVVEETGGKIESIQFTKRIPFRWTHSPLSK